MSTKITMAQLSALSGATPRDVHNWMMRTELSTDYEPALLGQAAARTGRFTKDNAMEITLLARLVQSGMTPTAAAERIGTLFDQLERKKPFGWFVFFGDTNDFLVTDAPPKLEALRAMGIMATVVNVTELRAQVDKFFDEAAS